MALVLHLPPHSSGLKSAGSVSRDRKFRNVVGPSLRTDCYVNDVRFRRTGDGILRTASRVHLGRVSSLGPVQCLAEINVAGMEAHSGPTQLEEEGGVRNWIASNVCRVELSECSALFGKLMANLQLLGILTALALGMGVAPPARASAASPPYSTGRRLATKSEENISVTSSDLPDDFETIEERTTKSGVRQNGAPSRRTVGHTRGVAMAAEDANGDDEFAEHLNADEDFADLSAEPYAITVPLRIVGLRGSVPPAWLKDFLGSQGKRVKLKAEFQSSLKSIFSDLSSALEKKQITPRSAMAADLVTIGDSWLSKAVSGGLLRPIDHAEQFEWYQRLGPKWQTFLRRDENGQIDSRGKVWGVPYRWGSLVIAYNRNKLQQHGIAEIKDWTDLWKPELAGRISMVASPREVVGAVLKSLGASYNVNEFEIDIPGGRQAAEEKFLAFQHQVRLFDDTQYLKTLGAGEVWVAVGWSEDIISFAKRTSNITVVAPQSGTSLWADLWAIPATTKIRSTKVGGRIRGPSPLVLQWLDFCLQPARGNSFEHSVLAGASPLQLSDRQESSKVDEVRPGSTEANSEQANSDSREGEASPNRDVDLLGQLTPELLAKCEFLEPLSATALDDFKWLLSRRVFVRRSSEGFLESLRSRFRGYCIRVGSIRNA